jgi:predicted nucleotidyltransferase
LQVALLPSTTDVLEMNAGDDTSAMVRQIVDRLVDGYAPVRVILFGSRANGEAHEDSDIDLLIVKDTDEPPLRRWMEVKRLLRDRDRRVAVSPLVYTPRELEQRLAIDDSFVQEALATGEVLYG